MSNIEIVMLLLFGGGVLIAALATWCFKRYSETLSRGRQALAIALTSCALIMIAIPSFVHEARGPTLAPAGLVAAHLSSS